MKISSLFSWFGFVFLMAMTSCFSPSNHDNNNYIGNSGGSSVHTPSQAFNLNKPDANRMQNDLIGHSLSEGIENGYHSSAWRWNIERGEISNFRILSIDKDSSTDYEVTATMRLSAMSGRA